MWKFFGQLITWLLVLVGWAFVSELQDYRELRKDRFARLSELRKRLEELEQKAIAFHTSEFDGSKVLAIQSALSSIARELRLLSGCSYIDNSYEAQLIDLRQSVTGRNFDRSDHKVQPHDDLVCLEILASREALDTAIVDAQISVARDGGSFLFVAATIYRRCKNRILPHLEGIRARWRERHNRNSE